jgi:hypothetical protein
LKQAAVTVLTAPEIEWKYDGDRSLTLRMTRGDLMHEQTITLPIPLYRGAWKPDQEFAAGDVVSFSGAAWVAERSTMAKPGADDDGWRLCVKAAWKGRSAFQVARANGWSGSSEKEWLACLRGPEGKRRCKHAALGAVSAREYNSLIREMARRYCARCGRPVGISAFNLASKPAST